MTRRAFLVGKSSICSVIWSIIFVITLSSLHWCPHTLNMWTVPVPPKYSPLLPPCSTCTSSLYYFRCPFRASNSTPAMCHSYFLGSLMQMSKSGSLPPSFMSNLQLMDFVGESHNNIFSHPVVLDTSYFYWAIILFSYWLIVICFI